MAKTLLFYDKPVALNREAHRGLRFKQTPGNFSFARSTNSIPLAGVEFAPAARDYPIVFSGSDASNSLAVALVGLSQDENYFVDSNGQWQGAYVPAFVRRYPFVLAEQEGGQFAVCLDETCPGFSAADGEPLFDETGVERPFLKNTLEFLTEYQGRMRQTQTFIQHLHEWALLKSQVIQIAPRDRPRFVLQGMQVVDEQKLMALDESRIQTLFQSGELGWIYAHLISLGNLQRLSVRFEERNPASAGESPQDEAGEHGTAKQHRRRTKPN